MRVSQTTAAAGLRLVARCAGVLLLAGCGAFDRGTNAVNDGLADAGNYLGAPWGGTRSAMPEESDTIRRVRGDLQPMAALTTEPGNVWPAQEAPRATLANPDAALRGIPDYRPGDRITDRPAERAVPVPSAPASPGQVPPGSTSRGAPARRGSSSPPPPPLSGELPQPAALAPPPPPLPQPRQRLEGQVLQAPGGPPVVQGAGTPRVGSYLGPDGRTGVVTQGGGITTLTDPVTGQVRSFPTPR